MNKRKLVNLLISIPFILAIAFFIIFLKYYLTLDNTDASLIMSVYLIRYRNIAIFCLIFGFILLIIKSIIDYKNSDIVYENSTYNHVLSPISNRVETETKTYSFNENQIVNDLLKGKVLNVNFIDSKIIDRKMKFINYSKENNSMSFIDLEKEKGVKNYYDDRYYKKCGRCGNIIIKDNEMCPYCDKEIVKKKNRFNPVIFAVNMIIILLTIIAMILLVNKIVNQRNINLSNINSNIKTVETK